jgi:hypothetical protein
MEGAVTHARAPRTSWRWASRLLPAVHWELHILQSGLARFAAERPWVGVPAVTLLLGVVWSAYWLLLPFVLVLCGVTRLLHPLELRLRRGA